MTPDPGPSLQERLAPDLRCFGCGPANPEGLRLRSFESGGELVATWRPGSNHEAFPGMLNGGIIGTLLDCHCNWAAAIALMRRAGADRPPCTVTAEYTIRMKQPTPTAGDVTLRSRVVELGERSATVDGEIRAGDTVTATCRGVFVAVKPGHPAYHRW